MCRNCIHLYLLITIAKYWKLIVKYDTNACTGCTTFNPSHTKSRLVILFQVCAKIVHINYQKPGILAAILSLQYFLPYWTTNSFYFVLFCFMILWLLFLTFSYRIRLHRLGPSSFYRKNIVRIFLYSVCITERGDESFMTRSDHTSADFIWMDTCRASAPKARLTTYLNPLSPQQSWSLRTHAGVFISGLCSVRIVSSTLHSNMDVEETAYSHPIYSDET